MLRQEFTKDDMKTLDLVLNGKKVHLMGAGQNENMDYEIHLPLSDGSDMMIKLVTAKLPRKDWYYRVTACGLSFKYASYVALVDSFPIVIGALEQRGVTLSEGILFE